MSAVAGMSAGSTNSRDSPATLTGGGGSGRSPACQCTSLSRGLARYPPAIPAETRAEIIPWARAPSPGGRRGVDDLLHVAGRNVLARQAADHRGREPLTQPGLGMGMLAGPLPTRRQAIG